MNQIKVSADQTDVAATLAEKLAPEELRSIQVMGPGLANPLDRVPRRAEPLTVTIITFVSLAVAEGVVYDAAKFAMQKAYDALKERFGADKVDSDESGS